MFVRPASNPLTGIRDRPVMYLLSVRFDQSACCVVRWGRSRGDRASKPPSRTKVDPATIAVPSHIARMHSRKSRATVVSAESSLGPGQSVSAPPVVAQQTSRWPSAPPRIAQQAIMSSLRWFSSGRGLRVGQSSHTVSALSGHQRSSFGEAWLWKALGLATSPASSATVTLRLRTSISADARWGLVGRT